MSNLSFDKEKSKFESANCFEYSFVKIMENDKNRNIIMKLVHEENKKKKKKSTDTKKFHFTYQMKIVFINHFFFELC